MRRILIATTACLLLSIGMAGCGGGASDIPEGHTADEIKTPDANPAARPPGADTEGPSKEGG